MNDDSKTLLDVVQLSKCYGEKTILDRIDLKIRQGEVVCLLGPSGAGKSTLLRCMNLLEVPTSGEILFDGDDIAKLGKQAYKLRQHIGMVFQHFNLFPHMSVLKNVMEGPVTVLGKSKDEARAIALEQLTHVGLGDRGDAHPSDLSGGQKQRVAIARALAMKPRIMLFDEPTSALDPELVGEVLNTMKALAETGMTMVAVTHEMGFARRVADRIVLLADSHIAEQAAPNDFFDNPQTERGKAFLRQLTWS